MGDVSGRRIVGVAAAIALSVAGCAGSSRPARDANDEHVRQPGVAEAQGAQPEAPAAAPGPSTPPAAGADEADGTGGSDAVRDPHRMRRIVGWITLSIGAEAAAVAIATSILIEHQKGIRDDGCNAQKVCSAEGLAAVNTISTIVPWNTATWFVAAAGLGVGTVLLITSQPESARQTAITLSPNSSGLGLGLRSTF